MKLPVLWISFVAANLVLGACGSKAQFAGAQKKSYEANAKYRKSFLASEIHDGSVSTDDGGRYLTTDLIMRELSPTSVTYQQITRNDHKLATIQGHPARHAREEFQVSDAGLLDLLVVIDDSASMDVEQRELGQRLEALLTSVKDTNWQIAVISESNPCVSKANLITKADVSSGVDIAAKFGAAVKKKLDPQATEQGFPMAIQALKGQCAGTTKKWIREGSTIGILIVSDEDNCGSDKGDQDRCRNVYGKSPSDIVGFLHGIRPTEQSRVFAIVKDDPNTCPDAGGIGTQYVEAARLTGGFTGSICAPTYTDILTRISDNVSRIVKKVFHLANLPDMVDFQVSVDGVDVPAADAWQVSGDLVTINKDKFINAQRISFYYSHDAVPKFDHLTLDSAAALDSLVVEVAGKKLAGSEYSVSQDAKTVTFSVMPAEDASVVISWREDVALMRRFALGDSDHRLDTLQVTLNGTVVDNSKYSVKGDEVEFSDVPMDGAKIGLSYRKESSKVQNYPQDFKRGPASITCRDAVTNEVLAANFVNSEIQFDHQDVIDGRKVTLNVDFGPKADERALELPQKPLPGTVEVLADGKSEICELQSDLQLGTDVNDEKNGALKDTPALIQLIEDQGYNVHVKCAGGQDYSGLVVGYKYESNRITKFEMPDSVPLSDGSRPSVWKVNINDSEYKGFTREGRVVTVPDKDLPVAAKVDIEVTTYQMIKE